MCDVHCFAMSRGIWFICHGICYIRCHAKCYITYVSVAKLLTEMNRISNVGNTVWRCDVVPCRSKPESVSSHWCCALKVNPCFDNCKHKLHSRTDLRDLLERLHSLIHCRAPWCGILLSLMCPPLASELHIRRSRGPRAQDNNTWSLGLSVVF